MDKAHKIVARRSLLFDIPKWKPSFDNTIFLTLMSLLQNHGLGK